jgi:hypothetical protein
MIFFIFFTKNTCQVKNAVYNSCHSLSNSAHITYLGTTMKTFISSINKPMRKPMFAAMPAIDMPKEEKIVF